MKVNLLRKIEGVVSPLFGISMIMWFVVPRATVLFNAVNLLSWLCFVVDVVVLLFILKYKGKDEPLFMSSRQGKTRQIVMPFVLGLVFVIPAYTHKDDLLLVALCSAITLLSTGFSAWLFINRHKLEENTTHE